ncbi:MAG: cyclic pyranopterin phosphate synthase [Bacteriovoracaceae bacterium]|jgi:cyclic pyranopterin phosphate synthase
MSFNHIDDNNLPTMVDVSSKDISQRVAVAISHIHLPAIIANQINENGELNLKKGPVFQTAIIAGTMATKSTATLIPFCHPLLIESTKIKINSIDKNTIQVMCTVKISGKTGVEMEALTGATIAALTIYDMCKALSHEIKIKDTYLLEKSGGKRLIKDGKVCD